MGREIKELIKEISIGIILYNLVLAAIATVVYPRVNVYLGLLVGMGVAMMMFVHMSYTYSKAALDSANDAAVKKKVAVGVILRSVVYLALLVFILWKLPQINIIAVALGALGLKAAAYLQPMLHRFLLRRRGEEVACENPDGERT